METINVARFKPYRTMRWYRSNYLWSPANNGYLSKYGINVVEEGEQPADVLAIPCPHIPGREGLIHQDNNLWITQGHRGLFDYQDTPLICDSSIDYAYLDPPMRDLISHPQVRAYLTGVALRHPVMQQRRSWGGEYYGMVYKERELYDAGPDVRLERGPLPREVQAKLKPISRPPTPPFSDRVFEHIDARVKPLNKRNIDIFFSGRTTYWPRSLRSHPTAARHHLEAIWPSLPGKVKVFKSYHDFKGTKKNGKAVKVFQYPYEYVDALMDTKIVISPWGWSPWCVRDLEALACGCIVIKPECSNMVIYPDIYDPKKQLMVWADLMYEGLGDQVDYCLNHLSGMQERVDRGRKFVLDALWPNAKIHAMWTSQLRDVLENAVNTNSYSPAGLIPGR